MLTLYQAEWCPFSSQVRERLTELGVDFIARQVEPDEQDRTVVDEIPTLELEDGTRIAGTRNVLRHLDETYEPWQWEQRHRERWREHRS